MGLLWASELQNLSLPRSGLAQSPSSSVTTSLATKNSGKSKEKKKREGKKEEMAWTYPGISPEDMVKLVKGFVDTLILASGYQSTGRLAHWDSSNIRKAFLWASFFEQVVGEMARSDSYADSVKELDSAIVAIKSDPCFPRGLVDLSCEMLLTARKLLLAHFVSALSSKDAHLKAFLIAIVEMDLDKLSELWCDSLSSYGDKLMQNVIEVASVETSTVADGEVDDLTKLALQALSCRQSGATCISVVETGLSLLSNAMSFTELDNRFCQHQLNGNGDQESLRKAEDCVDLMTFNELKSRNLAYLLNNRTVRLVSGSSLLFSAPKEQWLQVFERLKSSDKGNEAILFEIMELLLLGCIANQWKLVIEQFVSVCYTPFTISELLGDVCDFLEGARRFHLEEEADSKVKQILEYLAEIVAGQPHTFWKLPPVLVAAAIPCWSPLFRMYLGQLNAQFIGDSSTFRCCSCTLEEHKNCQLAERIWTMHTFHTFCSDTLYGGKNT